MKIIPISHQDQLKYGINFLTVYSNIILGIEGSSEKYKNLIKNEKINATWMNCKNMTSGFGAAHCCTQVLLRKE